MASVVLLSEEWCRNTGGKILYSRHLQKTSQKCIVLIVTGWVTVAKQLILKHVVCKAQIRDTKVLSKKMSEILDAHKQYSCSICLLETKTLSRSSLVQPIYYQSFWSGWKKLLQCSSIQPTLAYIKWCLSNKIMESMSTNIIENFNSVIRICEKELCSAWKAHYK